MSTFDHNAELALVSEALRRYERFVARGLSLEDFTLPQHIAVIEAAGRLWELGQAVTVGSVALELQRAGKAVLCGGERGLAEMAAGSGHTPDPERLQDLRRLRAVQAVLVTAHTHVDHGRLPEALAALADAAQFGERRGGELKTAVDMAESVLLSIRDGAEAERKRVYVGMRALDMAIGKLPIGSLTVIAADTGVGKSAFALTMLIEIAQANVRCGLIGAEDPEEITGARLMGCYANVSSSEIQKAHLVQRPGFREEMQQAVDGLKRLGDRFLFEDCMGKGDLEVRSAMSRMAIRGAKLVVVDYLGEISSSEKQQDRRNEMRYVAKRLKAHAKRIGVALVLVSQIARPKGEDEFKCPSKHALKESGDITNMAEVIIGLWRKAADDKEPVFARVLKCKWGGLGRTWKMHRDQETGRLAEAVRPNPDGKFAPFVEGEP